MVNFKMINKEKMSKKKYPNPKLGEKIDNWTIMTDIPIKYKKYRTKCYKVKCICGNVSMLPKYQLYNGLATKCGSCGSKSGSSEKHLGNDIVVGKYLSNCKHRAKKKGLEYNLDVTYLTRLFDSQGGRCALSKIPIKLRINSSEYEFTASLDRVDSSKGYVKGNVQWVHKWINKMKMDLNQDKFFELCRAVSGNSSFLGKRVISQIQVEGIHRWMKCPIPEVSFLKEYHRHMFHIKCSKRINHNDRDVEFIQLSHQIREYLKKKYFSNSTNCLFFDDMSCEMIAEELVKKFELMGCEVTEDGEGGAIIGTI